jgi:uncharacterized protein (TIGR00290 family)
VTTRTPILVSWSGGKDSALALWELLCAEEWEVVGLLTTVADEYRRVSHHGVREELLDDQAAALDLPLDKLRIPMHGGPCTNEQYEQLVGDKLAEYVRRGVRHVAHGDLFLADLRAYRERNLAKLDMQGVFPLWGRDTRRIVEQFEDLGFAAIVCCVEGTKLDASFAGRPLDRRLLADLPADVDPAGENGEYHSFVWNGPMFRRPVSCEVGPAVTRDGRHYVDLIPHGPGIGAAPDSSPAQCNPTHCDPTPTDPTPSSPALDPAALPPI